jgi:hypothetical protein
MFHINDVTYNMERNLLPKYIPTGHVNLVEIFEFFKIVTNIMHKLGLAYLFHTLDEFELFLSTGHC